MASIMGAWVGAWVGWVGELKRYVTLCVLPTFMLPVIFHSVHNHKLCPCK